MVLTLENRKPAVAGLFGQKRKLPTRLQVRGSPSEHRCAP